MTGYLDAVAEFATETSFENLPVSIVDRTKLIITDTVAAIVGGAAEPEIRALAQRLCIPGGGSATIIGMGRRADPGVAALLNGSAGTFLEMDEGNQFCKGHPGMHTIPACYAWAEGRSVTGAEIITAIAVGYDVCARVGIATNLRPAMHPHGTWGAIGAAVAIGRLAGFDADKMKTLLNISSNMCLASSRPTMLEGGTVRNMYTGISGQLGLLAYNLVEAGFTGERDGIQNVFGRIVSDSFASDLMTEQLGTRWEVGRNYFKLHSCCRFNHAALDALEIIVERHQQVREIGKIAEIKVRTYNLAAELNNQNPKNTLAAKFSLPFAIATTLINGSTGVDSFTWDAVRNNAIQDLAMKVVVSEDTSMSSKLPDARPAAVVVTMTDGTVLQADTETNRGDWRDPYSAAELHGKYTNLTARLWERKFSEAIYTEIMNLEKSTSLASLENLISEADQSP